MIHVTPIPSTIDLTTPAFVLGTSNTAGDASTAIASDSSLALFNTGIGSTIVSAATGEAGVVDFSSRQDHTHGVPTLATTTPTLGAAMQNFVEGGQRCLYMLGAPKASAFAQNDEVGFGQAFTFSYSGGTGTLAPSTTIRGGWTLTADVYESANLYVGDGVLSAADDFSVVYRFNRASDGFSTTYFGLATNPTHFDASDNVIVFYWSRTDGHVSTITDNGGSETVNSNVVDVANDTDVTFRIDITSNGGNVKFYVDDALEATHTTNIPTSTALYIYVMQKSQSGNTTTLHIGDIFAWRTS